MASWEDAPLYEPKKPEQENLWSSAPLVEEPRENLWSQAPLVESRQQQQQQLQPVEPARPPPPEQPPQPEPEGMLGSFARRAAHAVLPSAAFYPGFAATTAAAAPFLGPAAPLAGIVGGLATSAAAGAVQETGAKLLGIDDAQQLAVNAAANPWSSTAGDIAGALPSFGVGKGAQLAARGIGALAGGGLEAGAQYVHEGEVDPTRVAGAAVAGGALIKPRALTEAMGARAAKAVESWHGSGGSTAAAGTAQEHPPPSVRPDDLPQPPSGEAPPPPAAQSPAGRPPAVETFEGGDPAIKMAVEGTPITPRVFEGEEVARPSGQVDTLLQGRGFSPEQIQALSPEEKTTILQRREGEAGAGPPVEPPAPITQQLEQEFPRVPGAERQQRPLVEEPPPAAPIRRTPIGDLLRQEIPSDPTLLRQQAAQLREAGVEGVARQRELAADAIEKSRPQQPRAQNPWGGMDEATATQARADAARAAEVQAADQQVPRILSPETEAAQKLGAAMQRPQQLRAMAEQYRQSPAYKSRLTRGMTERMAKGLEEQADREEQRLKDLFQGQQQQQAQQRQLGGVTAARLAQRGYTKDQIGGMTPGAAREILANDYLPQQAIDRGIVKPIVPAERGITAPAPKGVDPATQALIKDALAKRAAGAAPEAPLSPAAKALQEQYEQRVQKEAAGELVPGQKIGRRTRRPAEQIAAEGPRPPRRPAAPAEPVPPAAAPAARPDIRQAGDFRIKPNPEGGHLLMRGDQVVSQHPNLGQAFVALNRAAAAAGEGPAARAPAEKAGRKEGPLPAAAEPAGVTPPAGAAAAPVPAPGPAAAGQPAARARGRPPRQQPTPAAQPAAAVPPGAPPAAPPGAPPPAGAGATPPPPLQPATAKDLSNSAWDSLIRTVAPEVRPSGRQGMNEFRRAAGLMDQMYQTQKARFTDKVWQAVNGLSEMDQRKFINYIQGGKELQTPGHAIHDPAWAPQGELLSAANDMRKNMLEWRKEIESWPQAMKTKFRDNFLNQEWQELQADMPRGGGVGGKGHLHERVFENDEAGRAAGYTPTTTNPLERWQNYALAMGRTAVEFKTQTALENMGALGWFTRSNPNVKGGPPKGYAPVNGWTKPNGAQAYVPADMAAMLNNQFAAHGGFPTPEIHDIVDKARRFKNLSTATELSLGLYHPFTTSFETIAGGIGRAVTQLGTGPGSTQRAIQSLGHAMLDPIHPLAQLLPESTRRSLNIPESFGKEWIERYRGQRPSTPEQQRLKDIMTEAGIRPVGTEHTLDLELKKMGGKGSLLESWRRGSLGQEMKDAFEAMKGRDAPKVAVNLAGRVLQDLAAPVFQHYVPILKMSSMVRDMQAYMAANPGATREQLVDMARQYSDSADNRIGEMVADHMGMNKAIKNISNLALRSFSFTVGGPFREIIPGAAAPVKEAFKGAKAGAQQDGIIGAVKGGTQRALGTLNMASDSYNRKTGYLLGYAVLLGLAGTIKNYLSTGEYPQDWRDIVTPRTGGMVSSGGQIVPERVLMPGYHKDFLGYAYHLGSEARAKLAAPWSEVLDQTIGDYRGDPVAPPISAAGLPANIAGRVEHAATRLSPLSFKAVSEPPKVGSNISTVERALGFRAPGAYLQNPERIEQVQDIVARKQWRTRERHENEARRAQGLPPLPARQFANEPGG